MYLLCGGGWLTPEARARVTVVPTVVNHLVLLSALHATDLPRLVTAYSP